MAEGKKSILVYADWIEQFESLTDEEAGRLIKHFFKYVNDQEPIAPDRITELSFIPIKQSLKRDLKKWEKELENKSIGGRIGNLKRWHLDLHELVNSGSMSLEIAESIAKGRITSVSDKKGSDTIASVAVNVNDSVSVNVNDKEIKEQKVSIEQRKSAFGLSLEKFKDQYPRPLLNDFFKYWSEANTSKKKMKFELQKTWETDLRLATWASRDKNFDKRNDIGVKKPRDFSK